MSEERICAHCEMKIAIRNPSGFCDHLYYPDNCEECRIKVKKHYLWGERPFRFTSNSDAPYLKFPKDFPEVFEEVIEQDPVEKVKKFIRYYVQIIGVGKFVPSEEELCLKLIAAGLDPERLK